MRSQQEVEENFQAIDLLKKIGRFQNFEDRDLRALVMSGRFRECEPGETIIREGEYDCWLYILLAGRLEIVKKGRTVRYLGRKGDMFGEMGVIDGSPRSATIRAVGEVQVLGIDGSVIDRNLRDEDVYFCYTIYRLFAELLAARLRETTEENIQFRRALARFGNP